MGTREYGAELDSEAYLFMVLEFLILFNRTRLKRYMNNNFDTPPNIKSKTPFDTIITKENMCITNRNPSSNNNLTQSCRLNPTIHLLQQSPSIRILSQTPGHNTTNASSSNDLLEFSAYKFRRIPGPE